jgi:hypothetical protein
MTYNLTMLFLRAVYAIGALLIARYGLKASEFYDRLFFFLLFANTRSLCPDA